MTLQERIDFTEECERIALELRKKAMQDQADAERKIAHLMIDMQASWVLASVKAMTAPIYTKARISVAM